MLIAVSNSSLMEYRRYPNIGWGIQLKSITGERFVRRAYDVRQRGLASGMYVDDNRRSDLQRSRGSNQSSVQVHRHGLARVSTTVPLQFDEHVSFYARTATTAMRAIVPLRLLMQLHYSSSQQHCREELDDRCDEIRSPTRQSAALCQSCSSG